MRLIFLPCKNGIFSLLILTTLNFIAAESEFQFKDATSELKDLNNVFDHRIERLTKKYENPSQAMKWQGELGKDGIWPDVDYATGCKADRANWHAPDHLRRILTIASAWSTHKNDSALLRVSTHALNYWFANDFPTEDCMTSGGRGKCPCSTSGFWNQNWWYQMILLPDLVGSTCLILLSTLNSNQLETCIRQTDRSWRRVDGKYGFIPMTGANLLDVTNTGGILALLTKNHTLFSQTLNRSWAECDYKPVPPNAQGIKYDGSFMQHDAALDTGTYGAVFIQRMLSIFLETRGTGYYPPPRSVQEPFSTLFLGAEWLMFRRGEDGLAWTYSAMGRWVAQKWKDYLEMNLDLGKVLEATEGWEKEGEFVGAVDRLRDLDNRWRLVGNRYFYTTDFLVHRGHGYMVTLKMFSQRTVNAECINSQNPYGYHLSDGTIYTQISGTEYNNVFGAWDWDLIPGTTSLYREVPLSCGRVHFRGKHKRVGAAAMDTVASVAIMTHVDPLQGTHNFTKTFFFFPGAYVVQFPELWWNPRSKNPMRTSLDQRIAMGPVFVDGKVLKEQEIGSNPNKNATTGVRERESSSIWHDRVGYVFSQPVSLGVGVVQRVADWEKIGISSGNESQTHFLAYVNHKRERSTRGLSYIARLNVDNEEFQKSPNGCVSILHSCQSVTAAVFKDSSQFILGMAFLSSKNYTTGLKEVPWVFLDSPAVLILHRNNTGGALWRLGLADPTQTLEVVNLALFLDGRVVKKSSIILPKGPYAGDTVILQL